MVTGELVMGKQIISITEKKQLLLLLCNSKSISSNR